jgi:hypothetical protein
LAQPSSPLARPRARNTNETPPFSLSGEQVISGMLSLAKADMDRQLI